MRRISSTKVLALVTVALLANVVLAVAPFAFAQGEVVYPELKLTLTNPSTNPARLMWGEVIQNNLKAVGIDCGRVIWDWDTIYDRVLEPPAEIVGLTYEEGGFDALFVGYAMDIDMDLRTLFKGEEEYYPPGQNYYLYDDDELDALLDAAMLEVELENRIPIQWEIQEILYEEQPSMIIAFFQECVVYDPALKFFTEGYWYPAWAYPEMWAGLDTCILAQTGPVLELNPLVSTSYYDLTAFAPIFSSLNRRENMVTALMEPLVAESWEVAEDKKTWTVHMRQDVYWHDGVQVTADDVVFSYHAGLTPELASPVYGDYLAIFGSKDNIYKVDDFTVVFALPEPYALFETVMLDDSILPKHILENVPYEDWRTDPFNTGLDGGPTGCGPYKYDGYDVATKTFKFAKNENYFLKDELEAEGRYTIEDYWVTFIEGWEPAIAALKAGEVHFLDSQYHPEAHLDELNVGVAEGWCDYHLYTSNGWQELGFNCRHPVWGTGVDTPLGKSDPTKAAEAARYLRQAVSHCIPRYQIVGEILQGVGTPGDLHAFPGQAERRTDLEDFPPYSFNLTLARELIEMAGYSYEAPAPSFLEQYGMYLVFGIGLVIAIAGTYYFTRKPT
ncbi:MAG: ABC transporter substrate-binding protein [Candidatus Bathyarchaeota archaeon]|nr:ABC transporter substrate-binding protein [Candidatus Bathyarchaeota archaeon]